MARAGKIEAPVLNPEQERVVEHFKGPLRVASVAGSGKTTTLVERVVFMAKKRNVSPSRVLCITFSKGAAEEMRRRIGARLPGGKTGSAARTFHSLGLDIYKAEAKDRGITIDSTGYLFQVAASHAFEYFGLEPELPLIKQFSSHVKNNMLGADGKIDTRMTMMARNLTEGRKDIDAAKLLEIYFRLEHIRSNIGVDFGGARKRFVTFDDMIYQAARFLQRDHIREKWSKQWGYMMVDEAQDTNPAQFAIVNALCQEHRNLVVLGDTAQSIYQFRGATPANLLDFPKVWPEAQTVIMGRNYRSGIEIIDAANRVLDSMPADSIVTDDLGMPPYMISERKTRSYVGLHRFDSGGAEGSAVADNIVAHNRGGLPYKDQAVLMRMNRMTRDVEIALALRRVPYKLVSGSSFFTMKEARVLLSYIRMAVGTASDEDLGICISKPQRRLGKKVVEAMVKMREEQEDWVAVAERLISSPGLGRQQRETMAEWADVIGDLRKMVETSVRPVLILRSILDKTGLLEWFNKKVGDAEDSQSVGNIDAVVGFSGRFATVEEMMDVVETVEKHRKSVSRKRDSVIISTVHKQKGLEYPVVYLIQAAEGLLPAKRADLHEERRVFYVAATRAKDELWCSFVRQEDPDDPDNDGRSSFFPEVDLKRSKSYEPGVKTDAISVGTQMGLSV